MTEEPKQKPRKMFVEYTLHVKIFEREGYSIVRQAEQFVSITMPLAAADALNLNAAASGILDDCVSELEEQEQSNDTTN